MRQQPALPRLVIFGLRMTKLWDRRIAKIDRRVGPLEWRGVRRQLRRAAHRKRRGLPSRTLPFELVMDRLKLDFSRKLGEKVNPDIAAKLQWGELRERLLERGRAKRDAARRRARRSVFDTRINVWRRRRDWLRTVQQGQGACESATRQASGTTSMGIHATMATAKDSLT